MRTGNVITKWFFSDNVAALINGNFVFTIVVLFLVFAIIYALLRKKTNLSEPVAIVILAMAFYVICYSFIIIYSATTTVLTPMDDRYLSPIFTSLALIFVLLANNIAIKPLTNIKTALEQNHYAKILARPLIFGLLSGIFIIGGANYVIYRTQVAMKYGVPSINNKRYADSQTLGWLKKNPLPGEILSNDKEVIRYWLGISAQYTPTKTLRWGKNEQVQKQERKDTMNRLMEQLNSGKNTYVVWFIPNYYRNIYDVKELQKICDVKLVKKFEDGFIVSLSPMKPSTN